MESSNEIFIVNEHNKYEFIIYLNENKPKNVDHVFFNNILNSELEIFIKNKINWQEALYKILSIIETQNSIIENNKISEKKKNKRPTNRKEKANLLYEATINRLKNKNKKFKKTRK